MQIKYVNFPKKENGKFGSIVMADGAKYMVPVGRLGLFRSGMDVEPQYETKTWGSDEVQVVKDSWSPNTVGAIIPQPNGHVANNTANNNPLQGANAGQPGYINRDVSITQQTLLKAFIGTGQFGLTDLPMLEEACTASAKRLVKAAS